MANLKILRSVKRSINVQLKAIIRDNALFKTMLGQPLSNDKTKYIMNEKPKRLVVGGIHHFDEDMSPEYVKSKKNTTYCLEHINNNVRELTFDDYYNSDIYLLPNELRVLNIGMS
jgi:hypothetical protein